MKPLHRLATGVVFGCVGLAGCGDLQDPSGPADTGGEFAPAGAQGVSAAVQVTETTAGPLVFALDVTVEPPADVRVEYWTADAPRLSVERPALATERVLLPRLLANTTYQYEVRAVGDDDPVTGEFTTDTLPTSLGNVQFTSTGVSTSPLIMLEMREPTFQGFVAVDSWGRVVWYHATAGASWSWTRRANGNFVFLDTRDVITEVTPEGEVVATLGNPGGRIVHHDVVATPQNTILTMTREPQAVDGVTWVGEYIREWTPETGELVTRWDSFEFLDPATDVGPRTRTSDWLHANSLSIGASGNIIMSLQFLDQVIAITPDYSSIAWRLGGPNATIVPDFDGTFSGQHTAAELREGRLLLFDNRQEHHDGEVYSRALELTLDIEGGVATRAWDFRPANDNFSPIISSARRLSNGNTIVAFGTGEGVREAVGPIEVYEVTHWGEVVWNLQIDGPRLMYRATPFQDIAGESYVIGSGPGGGVATTR